MAIAEQIGARHTVPGELTTGSAFAPTASVQDSVAFLLRCSPFVISFMATLLSPPVFAQAGDYEAPPLDTVTVVATGVSNMNAASAGDVSQEQIASQPLLRPAAVLENVPGLIVTQHSGEGKANQYFLRAFNLDH